MAGTPEFERPVIELEAMIAELCDHAASNQMDVAQELGALERKLERVKKDVYGNMTCWQRTLLARHPDRPYALDYIKAIFDDFLELHGDRNFADDPAIVGGMARLNGHEVMVIGQEKGRGTAEKVKRNFGMPNPEGYRKALRLMKMADHFNRPIITFVDTPGAYPGLGAEERGQGEAIAFNLMEIPKLGVPILSTVIGEGGSGGALGIAVGNRVLMMENAIYSVISPEGCASILFRDASKAEQAANALKISAKHLLALNVIDEIIPEPEGGAHRNPTKAILEVKSAIERNLNTLLPLSREDLKEQRYQRFRKLGVVAEA